MKETTHMANNRASGLTTLAIGEMQTETMRYHDTRTHTHSHSPSLESLTESSAENGGTPGTLCAAAEEVGQHWSTVSTNTGIQECEAHSHTASGPFG